MKSFSVIDSLVMPMLPCNQSVYTSTPVYLVRRKDIAVSLAAFSCPDLRGLCHENHLLKKIPSAVEGFFSLTVKRFFNVGQNIIKDAFA